MFDFSSYQPKLLNVKYPHQNATIAENVTSRRESVISFINYSNGYLKLNSSHSCKWVGVSDVL